MRCIHSRWHKTVCSGRQLPWLQRLRVPDWQHTLQRNIAQPTECKLVNSERQLQPHQNNNLNHNPNINVNLSATLANFWHMCGKTSHLNWNVWKANKWLWQVHLTLLQVSTAAKSVKLDQTEHCFWMRSILSTGNLSMVLQWEWIGWIVLSFFCFLC